MLRVPLKGDNKNVFRIIVLITLLILPSVCVQAQMVFDWVNAYSTVTFFPRRLAVDQQGNTLYVSRLNSTDDADPSTNTFILSKNKKVAEALILFDTEGNFINATSIQSSNDLRTQSIDAGPSGEYMVVGYFMDSLFATVNGLPDTLIGNNFANGFIGRINASGDFTYLKSYASFYNECQAVDVDELGNYYVSGVFYDSLQFNESGGKEFAATLDIFIAKYNSNDVYQWVYRTEGEESQITYYNISDVKVDLNGDVLVWGDHREVYGDSLDFEEGPGVTKVEAFDDYASFLMKLNSNGTFSWVNPYVPKNYSLRQCFAKGMEIDHNNDIVLYAQAEGEFTFNESDPTDTTKFKNNAGRGSFILKLNNNGQYQWVNAFEAIASTFDANNITVDTANRIYITGSLNGSMDADPGAGVFTISSNSNTDFFIAQYESDGSLIDANTYGASGTSFSFDIVADASGNVYGTSSTSATSVETVYIENIETTGSLLRYVYKLRPCSAPPVQQIDNTTLKANYLNVNYQWVDCNNDYLGSLADNNRYFTPCYSGTYALISSSYGCATDTSACFVLQIPPVMGEDFQTTCESFTWIDGNTYTSSNNTATYTVIGGSVNGCDSLVTLSLTINKVSDVTTSISGTTITANNASASYQWLDCDNNSTPIPGEANQSFTPTVNGNYAVVITENGCSDTSACVAITTINDVGKTFTVYPNPTHGDFSVDLGSMHNSIEVSIFNVYDVLIQSLSFEQAKRVNLSIELPSAVYIVKIKADDKKGIIRLVKE